MWHGKGFIVIGFCILFACWSVGFGGSPDTLRQTSTVPPTSENPAGVNTTRLAIVSGTVAGTMAGIHIYQSNGWWKDNRMSFHFQEDLTYALHVDKLGHFYGASAITFLMSKGFQWANVPERTSLMLGAGIATLFQTYVEIQDGFSEWGFDRVDFAASVTGAWYPVLQHLYPSLQNINLKFSYVPSSNINKPGFFQGQKHLMMDDYEGQTFWFSVKVNNLLPASWERYWPDFLGLTVGYGARDINSTNPYRVYLIGLDYDMTRIIPDDTPFLKGLGEALNFIRLPAPAIRIFPGTVWYGFYF